MQHGDASPGPKIVKCPIGTNLVCIPAVKLQMNKWLMHSAAYWSQTASETSFTSWCQNFRVQVCASKLRDLIKSIYSRAFVFVPEKAFRRNYFRQYGIISISRDTRTLFTSTEHDWNVPPRRWTRSLTFGKKCPKLRFSPNRETLRDKGAFVTLSIS